MTDRLPPLTLKATREALGLTHDHMAAIFHVRQDTYRRWESGRDPIPHRVTDELAAIAAKAEQVEQSIRDAGEATLYGSDHTLWEARPDLRPYYGARFWRTCAIRARVRLVQPPTYWERKARIALDAAGFTTADIREVAAWAEAAKGTPQEKHSLIVTASGRIAGTTSFHGGRVRAEYIDTLADWVDQDSHPDVRVGHWPTPALRYATGEHVAVIRGSELVTGP